MTNDSGRIRHLGFRILIVLNTLIAILVVKVPGSRERFFVGVFY